MLPIRNRSAWKQLPRSIRNALVNIEVPDCGCQLCLRPCCLIGAEERWGCRQRRSEGSCECTSRLLPACQLDHAGGCEKRRQGKRCRCPLAQMAECLSPGCDRRRRGRLCDCPRWPGDPCPHVADSIAQVRMTACADFLNRFGGVDPEAPDEGWFYFLTRVWPGYYRPSRTLPAPADLTNRETRVSILAERHSRREYLWSSQDTLYVDADLSPRNLARHIQHFASLLKG